MSAKTTETEQTSTSWKDKTLKAAGYSYVLGDAAMMAAGMLRGKTFSGVVKGAAIWAAGGAATARYGNPDADKQLKIYAGKLEHYLKSKGVSIPDDARAQSELLHSKSLWQHIEQFLYQHPSELLNSAYAIGAGYLVHEGIQEIKAGTHGVLPKFVSGRHGMSDTLWMGILVGAGALVGLFSREQQAEPDQQQKPKGTIGKAIAFVTEKPLKVSAALYGLNNVFLFNKAHKDFDARHTYQGSTLKQPYLYSSLQLISYLSANLLLFLSSKDQMTEQAMSRGNIAKLEQAAAAIIAVQPAQTQQAVLADVSAYMATQKGVTLKAPEIAQHVAARITELTAGRMQAAATQVKWADKLTQEMSAVPARS